MNGQRSGIYEALIVCMAALMVVAGIGGAVWLVTIWAEDRFGEMGSLMMATLGIVLVVSLVVVGIGTMFARIYRAGVVDTIKGQQITQQGNTQAVRDIAQAVRGELNQRARTEGIYERDVLRMADKKAQLLLADSRQQVGAPVGAQVDADIEASWYEVRNQVNGITYDE